MNQKMFRFWAWYLSAMILAVPAVQAQTVMQVRSEQNQAVSVVLKDLAQAQVVYLGETHDSLADHQAQLEILRQLHQQNPRLAIGLEMFQRPFQPVLDRYLAGEIDLDQVRRQTEYDRRWGFPWEYYAPILEFAQANDLPLIALNTPTEVTRKVAQQGLEQLSVEDLRYIPPLDQIRTDNAAYRALIRQAYESFHEGKGNSRDFERFFLAQVLWDETMADRVYQVLQKKPGYQVVVLAGQGHMLYGYGIPSRVARRWSGAKPLIQRIVLLNPDASLQSPTGDAIADYFWYSPDP